MQDLIPKHPERQPARGQRRKDIAVRLGELFNQYSVLHRGLLHSEDLVRIGHQEPTDNKPAEPVDVEQAGNGHNT